MIKKLLSALQTWARRKGYKKAVKEANHEFETTGRTVYVVLNKGEFITVTKRRLKNLRRNGLMGNTTIEQVEKHAVYTAKY